MKKIEEIELVSRSQSDILQKQSLQPQLNPLCPQEQPSLPFSPQQQAYQQLLNNWQSQQSRTTLYIYNPNTVGLSVYSKPVSQQKCDIFQKYTPEICKYLTAKFIIQEVVEPIEKYRVLRDDVLRDVEAMYVLGFRAWAEMGVVMRGFQEKRAKVGGKGRDSGGSGRSGGNSVKMGIAGSVNMNASFNGNMSVNMNMNKRKTRRCSEDRIEFVFNPEDVNLRYLVDPMIKLYYKTDTIFNKYHKLLTQREAYFKSKLQALTNFLFHHKFKQTQDRILCGFEGLDFTREEQINFMHENYLVPIIEELGKSQGAGVGWKEGLIARLSVLRDLLDVKIEKMEGYDDFQKVKVGLIGEWRKREEERREKEKEKGKGSG